MPDFQITYTGHVSEEGQMNGLPREIHAYQIVETATKGGLVKAIADQSNEFFVGGGMAVAKDPAALRDPSKLDINRMFVPMRWIVYIDTTIKQITNIPVPENAEGEPQEPVQ